MNTIQLNGEKLTIEQLKAITVSKTAVSLPENSSTLLEDNRSFMNRYIEKGYPTYGVTTGFGDSCHNQIGHEKTEDLQQALIDFHGLGLGEILSPQTARAVTACRLNSHLKGYSAIRFRLAELMRDFLNHDIVPCIPSIGSVGASGDLTPLSYLAAALCGQRDVFHKGERTEAARALREEGLQPVTLQAKEGLAMMNGTSVMTAIAALNWKRLERLAAVSDFLTASAAEILNAKEVPFLEKVSELKNHRGQLESARRIASQIHDSGRIVHYDSLVDSMTDISSDGFRKHHIKIQDRYSIRCAPHINGVLRDTLAFTRTWIENEMNSANDNPLFDTEAERVYNTGNFYGGHISAACDYLRVALANTSDLSDKQAAILIDGKFNNLTENLIPETEEDAYEAGLRHGFKAAQISISAICAEIHFLTGPMSTQSRPTESLNQDKVSMGTISARKLEEAVDLCFSQFAIHLLAVCQAMEIAGSEDFSSRARNVFRRIREISPFVTDDRPLEKDLRDIAAWLETTPLFDEPGE